MPSTQAPAYDPSHAAQMPCNNKHKRPKRPKKRLELPSPLTLWEAHVLSLSKRSNKRIIFDMEMDSNDDKKISITSNNMDKNDEAADFDAATQQMMSENQVPKATTTPNVLEEHPTEIPTETTAKLPPALLASLESVRSLSQNNPNTTIDNTKASNPPSTPTSQLSNPSTTSTHKYFGPHQTAALTPTTLHDDALRQEALIRTRSAGELTLKRRLAAEEEMAAAYREEDMMMSGALEEGDARCEVCQRRERAGEGGVESGVLAL